MQRTRRLNLPPIKPVQAIAPTDDEGDGLTQFQFLIKGIFPLQFIGDTALTRKALSNSTDLKIQRGPAFDMIVRDKTYSDEPGESKWLTKVIGTVLGESSVNKFVPEMAKLTQDIVQRWACEEEGIDMTFESRRYTASVIWSIVFGTKLNHDKMTILTQQGIDMFDGLFGIPVNLPFTRVGKAVRASRQMSLFLDEFIEEYRMRIAAMSNEEVAQYQLGSTGICQGGDSIIHNIMLTARLQHKEMSNESLRELCAGLLMGGTDTTAQLILALMFMLARGPSFGNDPVKAGADVPFVVENKVWRNLVSEQERTRSVHGENASYPDAAAARRALLDMTYLDACVKEAMRIEPPANVVTRESRVDVTLGEQMYPKGTQIMLDLRTNNHTDPMRRVVPETELRRCPFDVRGVYRGKIPHDGFDFQPDRWLQLEPNLTTHIGHRTAQSSEGQKLKAEFVDKTVGDGTRVQAQLPFGYGIHACVGRYLATTEMFVLFSEILRDYNIEVQAMPKALRKISPSLETTSQFRVRFVSK